MFKQRWALGFNDRGMGHGDYGVVVDGTEELVIEAPSYDMAAHIVRSHNAILKALDDRDLCVNDVCFENADPDYAGLCFECNKAQVMDICNASGVELVVVKPRPQEDRAVKPDVEKP